MAVCPFADQSKRYDGRYPGSYVGGFTWRLVLHTTETTGLPSYSGGSVAPHFTIDPRTGRVWQHYDTGRPSRALEHRAGTIDTNNARALQIEIVAYSDKAMARKVGGLFVGDLTSAQLATIARLVEWCCRTHGIDPRAGARFLPYPASYGDNNGVRLTDSQWRVCAAVVEHQDVPHNNHGDAGSLDVDALLTGVTDVPITTADADLIVNRLLNTILQDGEDGLAVRVSSWLISARNNAAAASVAAKAAKVDPAALAAALAPAIAAQLPADGAAVTAEQITQATEAGVRAVLGSLDNTPEGS